MRSDDKQRVTCNEFCGFNKLHKDVKPSRKQRFALTLRKTSMSLHVWYKTVSLLALQHMLMVMTGTKCYIWTLNHKQQQAVHTDDGLRALEVWGISIIEPTYTDTLKTHFPAVSVLTITLGVAINSDLLHVDWRLGTVLSYIDVRHVLIGDCG